MTSREEEFLARAGAFEAGVDAIVGLGTEDAARFRKRLAAASVAEEITYMREPGVPEPIDVVPFPLDMDAGQVGEIDVACRVMAAALTRVARQYFHRLDVAEVLPMEPGEEEWLALSPPVNDMRLSARVLSRWDCTFDCYSPGAVENARFFEVNSVDVGGIHYGPATLRAVRSALGGEGDGLGGGLIDPIGILSDAVESLARTSRRDGDWHGPIRLAVVENMEFDTGITEAASIVRKLRGRGLAVAHVDVREVAEERGRIAVRGEPVEVVYRCIELRDLVALEAAGADLSGMRLAARQGRVISSMLGEFDHKSLFEIATTPAFMGDFTRMEREILSRHIPWTRLVRDRRCHVPGGRIKDLLGFIRRNRETLVLKPNRGCGGEGVTLGPYVDRRTWEATIEEALVEPGSWVVQEFIPLAVHRFPVPDGDRFIGRDLFTVYGFFASRRGLGVLLRVCNHPVVNVSAGGGLAGLASHVKEKI